MGKLSAGHTSEVEFAANEESETMKEFFFFLISFYFLFLTF